MTFCGGGTLISFFYITGVSLIGASLPRTSKLGLTLAGYAFKGT